MPRGPTRQKINFNQVDCATVDAYLILRLGPIWSKVLEDYLVRNKRCTFITSRIYQLHPPWPIVSLEHCFAIGQAPPSRKKIKYNCKDGCGSNAARPAQLLYSSSDVADDIRGVTLSDTPQSHRQTCPIPLH